jgi:cell division protein FtsL
MRRPRLFTRTLLFMVLIFGVIATATSLISGWQLHHLLTTEYESKALALGRSMADSDLELILDKDAAAVQTWAGSSPTPSPRSSRPRWTAC